MMDDSDCMVQCPYDESHMVAKSRLSFHIAKCRKNPKCEYKRCPYNAAHDVEGINFNKHCAECPDRASVETWATTPGAAKTSVSVPCEPIVLPESEENWDSVEHPTYDPTVKIVNKPLFRSCTGESKAVRKNFRMEERERFRNMNVTQPEEVASPPEQSEVVRMVREEKPAFDYNLPVRIPKGLSKTFAVPSVPTTFVPGVHGMGRGRVPATETAATPLRLPPGFEAAAGSHTNKGKKAKSKGLKSDPPSPYVGLPAPPGRGVRDDRATQLLAGLTVAGVSAEEAQSDRGYGDWIPGPAAASSASNGQARVAGWTTLSDIPRDRPVYQMVQPDYSHDVPGRGRGRLQQQRDN